MPAKTYLHDRFLAATLLKLVPKETTPNQITVLRIFMTPAVVWFLYEERYALATPLFLVTALTDTLDGSLARTRDQVTKWGILWDPIADKLLIGSVALILMFRHFPPTLTAIILGLEAAFLAGGWYRHLQGETVAANWWGKFKMLGQVIGVTLYLLSLQTGIESLATASYSAFGVACVLAFISLFRHGL
ncbi:MAG TPA: CDP-alcohol phosphatidyltransferase family protein [Candidatus Baltobacteraceae bacterium]|nr:CDP-alcohol phosphatidyltransferase family protein [Candidatus Baltobacteraceae bacterium]